MNLTVKDLKKAFGNTYPVINDLVKDKPDHYIFSKYQLVDREDYIATKLWSREDIATTLRERGYKGTEEQVDDVLNACDFDEALGDCTDQDWMVIEYACDDAGYKKNCHKLKQNFILHQETST